MEARAPAGAHQRRGARRPRAALRCGPLANLVELHRQGSTRSAASGRAPTALWPTASASSSSSVRWRRSTRTGSARSRWWSRRTTSILAVEPGDREALAALAASYEKLGRHTDVVKVLDQQAEHSTDPAERVTLYRKIAWIWLDRFNNVNNATKPLRADPPIDPRDADAIAQRPLRPPPRVAPALRGVAPRGRPARGPAPPRRGGRARFRLAAEKLVAVGVDRALARGAGARPQRARRARRAREKPTEREKDYAGLADVLERRAEKRATRGAGQRADEARRGVRRAAERPGEEHRRLAPGARGEARPPEGDAGAPRRLHGRGRLGHAEEPTPAGGRLRGPGRRAQRERGAGRGDAAKVALSPRAARVFEERLARPARLPRVRAGARGGAEEPPRRRGLVPIYPRRGEIGSAWGTSTKCSSTRCPMGTSRAASRTSTSLRELASARSGDRPAAFRWALRRVPAPPPTTPVRAHPSRAPPTPAAWRELVDARRARRRGGRPCGGRAPARQPAEVEADRPTSSTRRSRALPGCPAAAPVTTLRWSRPRPPCRRALPLGRPPRALSTTASRARFRRGERRSPSSRPRGWRSRSSATPTPRARAWRILRSRRATRRPLEAPCACPRAPAAEELGKPSRSAAIAASGAERGVGLARRAEAKRPATPAGDRVLPRGARARRTTRARSARRGVARRRRLEGHGRAHPEPEYEATHAHAGLARALRILFDATSDPAERRALGLRLARVHGERLEESREAFTLLQKPSASSPDSDEVADTSPEFATSAGGTASSPRRSPPSSTVRASTRRPRPARAAPRPSTTTATATWRRPSASTASCSTRAATTRTPSPRSSASTRRRSAGPTCAPSTPMGRADARSSPRASSSSRKKPSCLSRRCRPACRGRGRLPPRARPRRGQRRGLPPSTGSTPASRWADLAGIFTHGLTGAGDVEPSSAGRRRAPPDDPKAPRATTRRWSSATPAHAGVRVA